jgi:hypothetical protein
MDWESYTAQVVEILRGQQMGIVGISLFDDFIRKAKVLHEFFQVVWYILANIPITWLF